MNPTSGGPSSPNGNGNNFSPTDRQRQTAAEIMRKRVYAAYSAMPKNQPTSGTTSPNTPSPANQNTGTYKTSPVAQQPSAEAWKKYHSAWQNYYQKYYSEYYANAAKAYIEKEKQKLPTTEGTTASTLKETIEKTAEQETKPFAKFKKLRHLKPLIAGIAVVLFVLFLQYNRIIFAPIMAYIAPGNGEDTGITAIDPTVTEAPGTDPRLIIPKLNVNVPVHFGISNDEATINEAMNNGVAQFAIPGADALPGQVGNLAISGHSAGDIYSNNQYKFIFSGLERLVEGDLIYINYNGVRYTYSVTGKETVEPTDVAALVYPTTKPMLTLITCTPLGTSRYRLLVTAEQISPNPDTTASNTSEEKPDATPDTASTEEMPSNNNTFFQNIINFFTGGN